MKEQFTTERVRKFIRQAKEPQQPQRRAVPVEESQAYILDAPALVARRGLYQALQPYRERYHWWQYQFLCHLVLSSQHDIMAHGDLPGVPIPWNAFKKSLPSMTKADLEALEHDGLMRRDHYDQGAHKCYGYFLGPVLQETIAHAYFTRSFLDGLSEGVCSLVTGRPQKPRETILYTHGKHEPPLIKQSFKLIRQNCLNLWELHEAFEQLKAAIATCDNKDYKQRLAYRYIGLDHGIGHLASISPQKNERLLSSKG